MGWKGWLLVGLALPLGSSPTNAQTPRFVRQGIALESTAPVDLLAPTHDDRTPVGSSPQRAVPLDLGNGALLPLDWQAEQEYILRQPDGEQRLRSPRRASPWLVRTIGLEDVSRAAATGSPPDSVVRFSPDSRRLAIGTLAGYLRVVDAYTGQLLHRQRIAEGQVKRLAWSSDGRQLYVGEQSPDAYLVALDAGSLDDPESATYRVRWRVRLADQLESSRLPAGDRFGIYSLPAVHDLHVADDGRLFVAGMHSWTVDGVLRNRSMIYCFRPDGSLAWRFPEQAPLAMNVAHLAIDEAGTRLAFLPSRTQPDSIDQSLPSNALHLLDARSGRLAASYEIEPLAPHFARVEAWDSVSVSPDGTRAAVGLVDGRALLFAVHDAQLELLKTFELGTPLLVGNTPISAACSYARFLGDRLFLQTQNTHIPFGSTQTANQAPSVHRGANRLTVADLDGNVQWRYRGPYSLTGHWADRSGPGGAPRWLLVTCRELPGAAEPGQFGCLLFDLAAAGGGSDRLVYHYPTAGPVIFHADISPDGRLVAITETPYPASDGRSLYGTHQVHLVH